MGAKQISGPDLKLSTDTLDIEANQTTMTKQCIDGQIVIPITLECRTRDISFLVVPTMEGTKCMGLYPM